jgi:hypothetical protein
MPLVPVDFEVPTGAVSTLFVLEPLRPDHNTSDLEAWSSSIDHIRATPGFVGRPWPDRPFTLEENLADLVRHAEDFAKRTGFTYTVLDPGSAEVVGCVYLYPSRRAGYDVDVRSWVREDRAHLDKALYEFVCEWLAVAWPFSGPDYAGR